MLDQLVIFTRGGLIMWRYQQDLALPGSPIDALIRSCLLEERSASTSFQHHSHGCSYSLKWTYNNDLRLVFVAVYRTVLHLLYVDELLAAVNREFSSVFKANSTDYPDFDKTFLHLLREAEARVEEQRRVKQQVNGAAGDVGKKKGLNSSKGNTKSGDNQKKNDGSSSSSGSKSEDTNGHNDLAKERATSGNVATAPNNKSQLRVNYDSAFNIDRLHKLKAKPGKKGSKASSSLIMKVNEVKDPDLKNSIAKKKNRIWDDAPSTNLDHSDPPSSQAIQEEESVLVVHHGKSLMDSDHEDNIQDSDSEIDEDAETTTQNDISKHNESINATNYKKISWFSSLIQSVAGKAVLDKEDLHPALKALKERLMVKNVAEEISEELCGSVATSLVGKKVGSFTTISSTVKVAMEEALVRILTPKRSIDILRDVHAAKEQGRPYVVVFCGVNGVGKSTNLSKVAYWLVQHNVTVMMAACDTFRSGAVEQLRTHANRLQISLFQRGYEKDPALVAKDAIRDAILNKIDVVLVDTAGRMQDNEPLMRSLAKLVHLNNPDLVLFVGEALVGNDGVDQLMKFNQKLVDLSFSFPPRTIDGILLTKFDTVDDKVGAALSMVYKSGAPIMFLGCGQTYTDLKKVNVKSIIKSLLH